MQLKLFVSTLTYMWRLVSKPEYHQKHSAKTKQVLAQLQSHIPIIPFSSSILTKLLERGGGKKKVKSNYIPSLTLKHFQVITPSEFPWLSVISWPPPSQILFPTRIRNLSSSSVATTTPHTLPAQLIHCSSATHHPTSAKESCFTDIIIFNVIKKTLISFYFPIQVMTVWSVLCGYKLKHFVAFNTQSKEEIFCTYLNCHQCTCV